MNVWNSLDAFPTGREPVYATIGNFDGVHLGHQAILASVINAARSRSAPSLLISFDPHPLAVVAPSRGPKLLQTRRQKLESIEATGVDGMLLLPFDRELAALTGEELDKTGNVELRTWITVLGAVGAARADVYCYAPSWHHGNAVVEWPL